MYKGFSPRLIIDFSAGITKERRQWHGVVNILKGRLPL
jgi:hypothetical protein